MFANGSQGVNVEILSANPRNYYHVISAGAAMPRVLIDGKLFLPPTGLAPGRRPLVIVVPGSLGVAQTHLAHAETLTDMGIAAFVLDPFAGRGVQSTVANQTLFSFAASAYDVLAAFLVLRERADVEPLRIGAQGHSRGGSAVLTAATRRFAEAVVGARGALKAVFAAYPWSGHQFLDPSVGSTDVRVLMGDRDEWCSPMQVQGHVHAMRLAGGAARLRLLAGAAHSFDRDAPLRRVDEARVSPAMPTAYIADDGSLIHPIEGQPNPQLLDRDLMVYGLKAGYGVKGASIGSAGTEPALFRADMIEFWRRTLLNGAS